MGAHTAAAPSKPRKIKVKSAAKTTAIVVFWVITGLLACVTALVVIAGLMNGAENRRDMERIDRSAANTTCEAIRDGLDVEDIISITAESYDLNNAEAAKKVLHHVETVCPQYL